MSDRLNELQRQRALMQEHLAWLDREIARESGGARPAATGAGAASPNPPGAAAAPAAVQVPSVPRIAPDAVAPADADTLIRQFAADPKDSQADVKRGCWIVFLGAFAAVGLVILTWWLLRDPA